MKEPAIVPIVLPAPFRVGTVNVFLIKSTPLTLVDAGINTDEAFTALETGFRREGLALRDIEVVLLTHTHIDHVGLLGRLRSCANFTVYAHADATAGRLNHEETQEKSCQSALAVMREFGTPEELVQRAAAEQRMFREYAADAAVDQGLEDGQSVGPYTVYHIPGHSANDLLYVDHAWRIAFTGDHVLPSVTPNSLLPRPGPGESRPKGLVQYCDSLRKTRSLDLDTCFPGHGGPITDHRAIIDSLFKRMDSRNRRVLTILGSQPHSVYEVARGLFPGADAAQMHLQLTAAAGHLDLLEEEGRVASGHRDGVLCFRAI